MAAAAQTAHKYPYFQCTSGMLEKFMPYHPVKSVSGRNMVVTTVKMVITLFCLVVAQIDRAL